MRTHGLNDIAFVTTQHPMGSISMGEIQGRAKHDFQEIFDATIKVIKKTDFYCHFAGIEHEGGNKRRCTPIKKGDMRFEPLADCILDNDDYTMSIISGSPLLEHDAVYMKVIYERVSQKRMAKEAKDTDKKPVDDDDMD